MKPFDFNKYIKNNILLKEEQSVSPEQAVDKAIKLASKIENSPEINAIANNIAKDPKALQQLQNVLKQAGVDPNQLSENIDPSTIKKLAIFTAKKAEDETISEGGWDYGSAFWTGLVGGGALANYIAQSGEVLTQYQQMMGYSQSHMTETSVGALVGVVLAIIATKIYKNKK